MNNADVIAGAREQLLRALKTFAPAGQPYALLDFPNYWNIGDSAIWAGGESLLRELTGSGPSYVSTAASFDAEKCRRHTEGGTIFLQGGGNFGDIYPLHQRFRESILREFKGQRVVVLPQTIHYRDPAEASTAGEAFALHGNAHLLVRDRASADFARSRLGCDATLVPDAAFGLGELARIGTPTRRLLLHLRQDVERVDRDDSAFEQVPDRLRADWPRLGRVRRTAIGAAAEAGAALRGGWTDRRAARYHAQAAARIDLGIALLSRARTVVTDRLHGHILCTLLGLPHVALDNDYGKVHAYIDAWTGELDTARRAGSVAEAVEQLSDFELSA